MRRFIIRLLLLTISAETFVAPACGQESGGLSSEQIRDTASQVMQQHDYRSVRRRILENIPDDAPENDGFLQRSLRKMGEAVGDFLEWVFNGLFAPRKPRPGTPRATAPPSRTSGLDVSLANVLLALGLAALIGIVIWILSIVFKFNDGGRKVDKAGLFTDEEDIENLSVPPGELAASTYESRAMKLAADGNFRAAIRELLLGGMSWIERAGMIRFRKGLTNRDYIRAVWREEQRRFAYGTTALEFERVYFGRREATREMFENCLQAFQGAFREEAKTTAV